MGKKAFLFPGQGSQYVGMGKELYEKSESAKRIFDEIFSYLDFDLKTVMFEGPEEKLKETKYTQPAIVAMSIVLTKLLEEKGIKPDYAAGHSLGEYSALGATGVLTSADTVKLTALRGSIMSEVAQKVNGTMAAVLGITSDKIEEICKTITCGVVEAVNYNEPTQTVIAGEKAAIEEACLKLKEAGAKRALVLPVSGPFHSSLMKPAGEELKINFEKFNFKNAEVGFVANTDAKIKTSAVEIKNELYAQTFGPVKWVDTINELKVNGVTEFYEVGPGKVLKGLVKKIDKEIDVVSVEKIEDIEML